MLIAVLNRSGLVSEAQAVAMTHAVSKQIRHDAAPAWEARAPHVHYFTDIVNVPNDAAIVTIRDSAEVPGALGDHDQDDAGRPRGEVLVRPILDNGGSVLGNADVTVSSVLSHEVLELWADPYIVTWDQGWDGTLWARELCDAVESDSYYLETRSSEVVLVSNFLLREWFTSDPPRGTTHFDWLGKLNAPFSMTPGGYVIKMTGGVVSQEFGAEYPEWRRAYKTRRGARTRARFHADARRVTEPAP